MPRGCRVYARRTARPQDDCCRRSAGRVRNARLPQPLAGRAHGGRARKDGFPARRFRLRHLSRRKGSLERELPTLSGLQRLCPEEHRLPGSGTLYGHRCGGGDRDETYAPHRTHPRDAPARRSHSLPQSLLHTRRLALRVIPQPRDPLLRAQAHRDLPLLPSRRGEPLRFLLPPRCRRLLRDPGTRTPVPPRLSLLQRRPSLHGAEPVPRGPLCACRHGAQDRTS